MGTTTMPSPWVQRAVEGTLPPKSYDQYRPTEYIPTEHERKAIMCSRDDDPTQHERVRHCQRDVYCMARDGHPGECDIEYPPEPDGSDVDQCLNCGYFFPDNSNHFNTCEEV